MDRINIYDQIIPCGMQHIVCSIQFPNVENAKTPFQVMVETTLNTKNLTYGTSCYQSLRAL